MTTNNSDSCSKRCDLINQINAGEVKESWFCRTHKRPYYPNRKPTMSNSDSSWVDTVLGDLAEELINYEQRMTDSGAPPIRFVHKYTNKAKQEILQKMNEAVEKDPRYLALKIRASTAENKLKEVTDALSILKSLESKSNE